MNRPAARRAAQSLAIATIGALALLAWAPHVTVDLGAPRLVGGPAIVMADSPEPSAPGGDTRSAGEGPGLVGAPFLAILGVLGLGLVSAGATLLYLRLAGDPRAVERARAGDPDGLAPVDGDDLSGPDHARREGQGTRSD